jgi:hypothetical protein
MPMLRISMPVLWQEGAVKAMWFIVEPRRCRLVPALMAIGGGIKSEHRV